MKRIITFILIAVFVTLFIIPSSAKSLLNYGGWIVTFSESEELAFTVDSCELADAELVVPTSFDGVKVNGIGSYAFANNKTARAVTLNSYIASIGEYAFINCTVLTRVSLTPAVSVIGQSAFSGTAALKNINLQDSIVTEIKPYTFLNSGIEEVTLPATCTKIDNYAFGQCYSLKKITIPKNVTEIHQDAFISSENTVICCYSGSVAHTYAQTNGISYVLLDAPQPPAEYLLGDTDGNGDVDVVDATWIQRYCALMDVTPIEETLMQGDVDDDGDPTVIDATFIMRYAAEITIPYRIGELVSAE